MGWCRAHSIHWRDEWTAERWGHPAARATETFLGDGVGRIGEQSLLAAVARASA